MPDPEMTKATTSLSQAIATAIDQSATLYCSTHGRWPEEVWYDVGRKMTPGGGVVFIVHAQAGDKAPPARPGQLLPRDVVRFGQLNWGVAEA